MITPYSQFRIKQLIVTALYGLSTLLMGCNQDDNRGRQFSGTYESFAGHFSIVFPEGWYLEEDEEYNSVSSRQGSSNIYIYVNYSPVDSSVTIKETEIDEYLEELAHKLEQPEVKEQINKLLDAIEGEEDSTWVNFYGTEALVVTSRSTIRGDSSWIFRDMIYKFVVGATHYEIGYQSKEPGYSTYLNNFLSTLETFEALTKN